MSYMPAASAVVIPCHARLEQSLKVRGKVPYTVWHPTQFSSVSDASSERGPHGSCQPALNGTPELHTVIRCRFTSALRVALNVSAFDFIIGIFVARSPLPRLRVLVLFVSQVIFVIRAGQTFFVFGVIFGGLLLDFFSVFDRVFPAIRQLFLAIIAPVDLVFARLTCAAISKHATRRCFMVFKKFCRERKRLNAVRTRSHAVSVWQVTSGVDAKRLTTALFALGLKPKFSIFSFSEINRVARKTPVAFPACFVLHPHIVYQRARYVK